MHKVFGHVSLSAHMLLLGKVVNHSADFAFSWPLIRAVLTDDLWRHRNAVIFQHEKKDISAARAHGSLYKVSWLMNQWKGKQKDIACRLAGYLVEALKS